LFGAGSVEAQRLGVDSTRGYGALYYPWLRVLPAGTGAPILVPPSGHVCGIMARVDNNRGVFKAPANEIVNGALGIERNMSDVDQGQLNLQGINIIRLFQTGGRPILWGARTTATDRNWQYVNVRRLFLFIEESIQEGIRYAVFEPNNLALWQKLKRSITEFLTRVWRDGGLFGAKAEDAFYVRIDETLNPFSEQALGRLNIEIGLRPTYPAEFIIVRIGIFQGGSEVTEG
jgi:phage tail sheath protein FI